MQSVFKRKLSGEDPGIKYWKGTTRIASLETGQGDSYDDIHVQQS